MHPIHFIYGTDCYKQVSNILFAYFAICGIQRQAKNKYTSFQNVVCDYKTREMTTEVRGSKSP